MKAIVTTRTDHTNVYGYVDVEPINDDGTSGSRELLPKRVRELCQYQWPSQRHVDLKETAKLLKRLGWTVLNDDGEPFFV